jgi:hypothetical protein
MRRWLFATMLLGVCGATLWFLPAARGDQPVAMKIKAPDLTDADEWINSKPLQFNKLEGKVVVLHFWTFS